MASYESYNWDGDEKWKEYLQNVTVPASGNEQQMMDRLRKRYFKKNINPDYDDSPPSTQQTSPPPQSSPPPQRPPQASSQSQSNTSSQSQPQQPRPRQQQLFNLDNIWTISHIYLIVNAILFVIPMTSPEFSYNCYRRALYSGCVAYGTSLYRSFALLAFVVSIFQFFTGSASLIVVLTLWQFVTYRYQTSAPSTQMVDMYSQRVGTVFQHRWCPRVVGSFYNNTKTFFSNYAQSR